MKRSGSAASVIVVGAGPAGATAARALALSGVLVTLLDRSSFPRNKPCGGGISARALRRFPYLERALRRIPTHALRRLHLEGPDGGSALVEADETAALMIRRVEFDALLVSLALEAGATLVAGAEIAQASASNDRVLLQARDGRRFDAPFVIAADGVHSVVARRLGLNRQWPRRSLALDMMEETPRTTLQDVDSCTMWVAYGYESPFSYSRAAGSRTAEGYAYVFPKRDHVNVGLGYVLSYYRDAIAADPYDLQRQLVSSLTARGVMAGESSRRHFTPFLIPVGGPLPQTAHGRVLLTGDAGGFVNAITAEGIYYAMVTGELAARAIIDTADDSGAERTARRYRQAWRHEIGAELRDSVLIQRHLFAHRSRIARVIRAAATQSGSTRALLDYAIGRRSYASARRHLLTRYPRLAVLMLWERCAARLLPGERPGGDQQPGSPTQKVCRAIHSRSSESTTT
jgi:geranylgeranyl reductase family protein